MTVLRIVANIAAERLEEADAFYGELLGLHLAMDLGFIVTFASDAAMTPQISIMLEGGAGTPVPDLSIEVDDVEAVYRRALAQGFDITYGPCRESWGVRRFFVRDPFGRLVNILSHEARPSQ